MTGKQIIIDVTQCPYYKEDKTCTYLSYKSKCEGDCNWTTYKELEEKLLRKEQECEKLKSDLIEAKAHGDYLNNLALSETLNLVSEQLDQLKAENEILEKDKANLEVIKETLKVQFKQFKQTLAEIKEIVEPYNDMSGNCVIVNCFKDMYEILQKINECEVDK